jgi:hypothetical protein
VELNGIGKGIGVWIEERLIEKLGGYHFGTLSTPT